MNYLIKPVNGYEGYYEIDNNGIVYGVERLVKKWDGLRKIEKRIIKQSISRNGYLRVNLSKNGICKKYLVHRIVAIAFLLNDKNKPEVNHVDGNKINNSLENLEWVSKSENIKHAINKLNKKIGFQNIKGEVWYKKINIDNPAKKTVLMFDKNNVFIKEFNSLTDAGIFLGKHPSQISFYINGKRNNKKFNFKYKNQ
jgi:hypothetical protein